MPGHFTHIYTARRVADLLLSEEFSDWPDPPYPDLPTLGSTAFAHYDPAFCGEIMQKWEKFTAIGAIGPDLFYFSQDYNNNIVGPHSDLLMLALATYYYIDAAKEDDWEPLLIILAEVNEEFAGILRILIKLQKIWNAFVDEWNATVGPLVDAASEVLDDLTGGLLSQFGVALNELKDALIQVGEEELLTFTDIFGLFDTCIQKGWDEQSFLWSDMSHYRNPSGMCQALVDQAEALRGGEDGENRFQQFLAFALGYMTHVGTDTIAHSFVNEQCGGPFRHHPQRHHLLENHIDAWNYKNAGSHRDPAANPIPTDPWGSTEDYPDLSMSALWFAVQLTPDNPQGEQRPSPLPDDPKARKEALDVDGEMPDWMAEAIVRAMMQAFAPPRPHPQIYGGDTFQQSIDNGLLTDVFKKVTGHGLDRPFDELLAGIAPPPSFPVSPGFPLPWQIQTMYRIMISFYKFSYNGTWELQKPRKPDFIITPPASDIENLFQPPDFSGVDSSNPIIDVCEVFIALFEWAIKELGAAAQLVGDLIKMLVSPSTYLLRLGLYELAMMVWDVTMKTHDVMAHTGFMIPHSEQRYDDGELRLPNEIDLPLITLGGSVDSAFRQALADAIDPFANLDTNQDVIGTDHSIRDDRYPYYPVLKYHVDAHGNPIVPPAPDAWEYKRPWAYPNDSVLADGKMTTPTPTEIYDGSKPVGIAPPGPYPTLRPGPYPAGTRPDHVFFRTDAPIDFDARAAYEQAQSPAETDQLNHRYLDDSEREADSPLGDPVPFSAYLIGQLVNHTGYATQFNLDSDRGYGYLTWDWIRSDTVVKPFHGLNLPYHQPNVAPVGDGGWRLGTPLQLQYVDVVPSDIDDTGDNTPQGNDGGVK